MPTYVTYNNGYQYLVDTDTGSRTRMVSAADTSIDPDTQAYLESIGAAGVQLDAQPLYGAPWESIGETDAHAENPTPIEPVMPWGADPTGHNPVMPTGEVAIPIEVWDGTITGNASTAAADAGGYANPVPHQPPGWTAEPGDWDYYNDGSLDPRSWDNYFGVQGASNPIEGFFGLFGGGGTDGESLYQGPQVVTPAAGWQAGGWDDMFGNMSGMMEMMVNMMPMIMMMTMMGMLTNLGGRK